MTEPDVTLTDYALTVLCLFFLTRLKKSKTRSYPFTFVWQIFFASVAFASFIGGTVHGFFLDPSSLGHQVLWPMTLLSIGVTASAGWILAGLYFWGAPAPKWLISFSIVCFLAYSLTVIFVSQSFVVVILNYLPAMVALFISAFVAYQRTRLPSFLWILGGIGISFFAAYVQQAQLGLHPQYFNHNSTYHLLQAVGLFGLYKGAKQSAILKGVS